MKLSQLFAAKTPTLSFEVFPPKTSDLYDSVKSAVDEIASFKPDYMSVTYGAGGGTSEFTAGIASEIKNRCGVEALAHLSCVSSTREQILAQLRRLKADGIENVLALRGDLPPGDSTFTPHYRYASELIPDIRSVGDFCIGGACYPEGHPESPNSRDDLRHVREKVDAGCDFLVTQMFFDNNILYNYLFRLRDAGVNVPVVAGLMPVTNGKQVARICRLSGTQLPRRFMMIVDRFGSDPDAMRQAGIAYATEQIIDLFANGVNNVHLYIMNKPEVAAAIRRNLSYIIPSVRDNQ